MRSSIIEQAKKFILESKKNNNYVYYSSDIKLSLKNYLVKNWLLISPIRWIFILKASSVSANDIIKKYKINIIQKLWWVISWDFALNFYTTWVKNTKEVEIINNTKNFTSFLWEERIIKVTYKMSKVPRLINKVKLEGVYLNLESPISFIINNFNRYKDNKKFHELILKQDINAWDIVNLVINKFKLSWISKLAIFYKNNNFNWRFLTIQNELSSAWKKIDRRNNKINIKKIIKKESKNNTVESLDQLF